MAFLNKKQQEKLKSYDWDVRPDGFWTTLYCEDFNNTAWTDLCGLLGESTNSTEISLVCVGIKAKES